MKRNVNWKKFKKLLDKNEAGYGAIKYRETVDKLLEDEIFSFKPEGNYQIVGCNVVLNPHSHILTLYFTRKSDAVKYANKNYGNALYEVMVDKIETLVRS
ncbi:MAG: hypothetical protein ABIE55_03970 [Candidatus Aenigmatarchaeota archaeon]